MNKIFDKINRFFIKITLKRLGKFGCYYPVQDDYTHYLEPGNKTKARFCMFETTYLAIKSCYPERILKRIQIHSIEINEDKDIINILIFAHRPGLLIGKNGDDVDKLRNLLKEIFGEKEVSIDLHESPYFYGIDFINLY